MPRSRYDIEKRLQEAAPRGSYAKLADHRAIKVRNVSKYYDPNDTTYQSTFSKSLLELQVIAFVAPQWAASILRIINELAAEWIKPDVPVGDANVYEEIGMLAMKLNNPQTPYAQRPALVARLKRLADAVDSGQRFDGIEDAEGVNELVGARA